MTSLESKIPEVVDAILQCRNFFIATQRPQISTTSSICIGRPGWSDKHPLILGATIGKQHHKLWTEVKRLSIVQKRDNYYRRTFA